MDCRWLKEENDFSRKTSTIPGVDRKDAAGSLIVIGAAIGQFVHPGGFGLSAFVGAGLVFAGSNRYLWNGNDDCKDALEPVLGY